MVAVGSKFGSRVNTERSRFNKVLATMVNSERQTKPAVSGNPGYFQHHLAGVEPVETGIRVLGDQLGNPLRKLSLVKTRFGLAHADSDLGRLFSAAFADRQ